MTDVKALEVFYWTATLGSFSRAAEYAKISQPAVSQRIASLEREFGQPLIERGARTFSLTAKGRNLLVFAERFLRLHADMKATMGEDDDRAGVLRLGVSETIVHSWLAQFINEMSRRFPRLEIDVAVDLSSSLSERVLRKDVDLAFLVGPTASPMLVDVPLSLFPLVWVASPELNFGNSLHKIDDITRLPIITYPRNSKTYLRLNENLTRICIEPPKKIYCNDSLAASVKMVVSGLGVGALPAEVVHEELATGKLHIIQSEDELPELSFTATYLNAPDSRFAAKVAEIASDVSKTWHHNVGLASPELNIVGDI